MCVAYVHVTENNEIAQGLIQKQLGYPVKFWHYIPENLEECLYIIIMSRYTHNHLPPPPSKIPVAIQNNLKSIISEENILDLTVKKLITHMYFSTRVPLSELHPALNNRSKIDHMITTKRHAKHSYGQDIMGVAYMLLKQKEGSKNDSYIRSEVCAYIENFQKSSTYKKLFEELFIYVEQDCRHSIEFQHVHRHGIGCILADEHQDQALGLDQYLAEKFLIFNATEHLERIYKLCTDKRQPWVLASLSPAFTKISPTIWANTPFTTNARKLAYANINRNGYGLSLLVAIQ
ncbi:10077_t:CDS:2, partial [Racocetra persica]